MNLSTNVSSSVKAPAGLFRRLLVGLSPLLVLPSIALAVPIAAPINNYFYSIQLRGISFGPTGETVGVHVFDATYDAAAYGSLVVTDLTTSTVLFSFTGGDYGNYTTPGSYDTPTFLLPYGDLLQYQFAGQEFSGMSIILGGTGVAGGGTYYGSYPTYLTTEVISDPNAVPESTTTIGLLAASLVGLAALRRKFARA